jgi:Ca2+-binding RTX toxin-like protein
MATYDLHLADLNTVLANDAIASGIITGIDNYLINAGDFTGTSDTTNTAVVQETGYPPFGKDAAGNNPQVLIIPQTASTDTVNTGNDAGLQVIADEAAVLNVAGSSNLLIATGDGNVRVSLLSDSGNDLVQLGAGADTVTGGTGADTIEGGSGANLLQAGTGNDQLIIGGSGADTLVGSTSSTNSGDTLRAGAGQDVLHGNAGTNELLDGTAAAADTMFAGTGGDTLLGGTGNDVFHVQVTTGSDTIDGGGGNNSVFFDDHAQNANVVISSPDSSGVTTVTFTDTNQTFKISNVTTLHFSDGTTHTI